ncbi:MAG TPA: AraC family transcriptional regulator [Caulobacteraceae bacterium]
MDQGTPIWILQGPFGRATVNLTDKALVEHAHREFNILFKLGGADTAFRSGGETLPLDDDSVLLFNPWVPHAKLAGEAGPAMILSLIIEPAWLVRVLANTNQPMASLFPHPREKISEEVRINANRLAAAISTHLMAPENTCEDLLEDLIDSVTREYADPSVERDIVSTARPIDYRIRKALAYIHEHALENPKIDEIAKRVGLSRSRFFEQFRRCVGASPQHYIDCVRMAIATRWLSTTDRPLIDLADELGFGAHSNFTRFFTQHIGVSPSEFRRQTITMNPENLPPEPDVLKPKRLEA